jgi:hypothetical protein
MKQSNWFVGINTDFGTIFFFRGLELNTAELFVVVKVIAVYLQFYSYTFLVKCVALQTLISNYCRYK